MAKPDPSELTTFIKNKAREIGFTHCGISKAVFLEEEAPRLEHWLKSGKHGKMSYMERNFDKRLDPRLLVDGAKSVISLMINYAHPSSFIPRENYRVARFALGVDYHTVIKEKLEILRQEIEQIHGPINYRVFTDSAPVLERAWAQRSGLGWIGKNANLINSQLGSWFLLGEIISDLDLTYDIPYEIPNCGTCTRCIDLCPSKAIVAPMVVDATRCLSYLSTEFKGALPADLREAAAPWIFGCDICQEVCPWNKFSKSPLDNWLNPNPILAMMSAEEWENISLEAYDSLFRNTGIERIGYERLRRNIVFLR
ncbi:MAG: tRNA epoxyqueuosine(34) reductase QueG [Bacteroidota bacterium]